MCTRGEWQLKTITIQFSEVSLKGLGMRFFLQHLLPRWHARNPQVKVNIVHQLHRKPEATFYWANGASKVVYFPKVKAWQIEKVFDLYRNSDSANEFLSQAGPHLWTERRSIQGLWQPSLEGQVKALNFCFRERRQMQVPKYSLESIQLCRQAVGGSGRWGSSSLFPKGWDTKRLQDVLCRPLKRHVE